MLAWARSVGLKYGIVVVILNSAKLKGGKLPKCILGCERGGKYEPPRYLVEGQSLQRNTGTRKCDCPFQLRGIPQHPYGIRWGLEVISGVHNHEIAKHIEGHEYPSRLKPIEKQFVVDMANSTAPREILNILKQKDPSNTTGIKSIYNTIFSNKAAKLDGLTPIQYVIRQLLKEHYLHQFLTNPDTNEITDIIWVHPMSLELSVNFPSVLIIDATYKTNEYRKPLLEVVGITSTWRTYSLMFAYLSNEREETLTWALDNLKNWMLQKGASMPLVFVSDRDLALMNAIETCFPTARHILCIWHINQCVMKNCSRVLGSEWKRFVKSWHSLINSSTPSSFEHKWQAMCDDFRQFPYVITYLWQTWLRSYKERFVSAWTDTCMHLGSNSSQRAESAHARLKLYLGDTMSSLQTSFDKIHKMLKNQFGEIKKSFEKSLNIPRHKQLRDDIFDQVRCRISLEAMEFIHDQLETALEVSPHIVGYCNCTIKITHGLPCMHDLAYYRSISTPIPLWSIHAHWTRLSMHATEFNEEGARSDRTSQVVEILDGMDPPMREHIIDRIIDMADPSRSTIRPPSYNTEHRGRPTGRDEQSTRRIPSFSEASTSGSRTATSRVRGRGRRGRGSGVRNTQFIVPSIIDPYIQRLPQAYQRYISHTVDVLGDGHCGFRAIAALIGYSENDWSRVREELIEEIQQNYYLYTEIYPVNDWAKHLLILLNWFEPTAPKDHWMEAMTLGVVIATRYNLVLHTFDEDVYGCFTHLPLRSPPVSVEYRREIAIARVNNDHFVQIFLEPNYPVPPIPIWWEEHSSDEAKGWAASYETRLLLWYEVMGISKPGAAFGGDID
ncbi:uncharacterized protein LOC131328499 [Rhododendron vialii]|uniref:uncharacterized protein LOC131328499 n=1 Tax=Rhododendron vialii TaxID=182163 RepID=UPI0026603A22|nr:uncharacterized protein LOC131328499 [Rhododendron vialii]